MKKSLVIALALMLVLAFAGSAMAAQTLQDGSYLSTTATGLDRTGSSVGSTLSRTYLENKFNPNGITNYPYEIYLPNETNPANYRIHSNYAKNTDACASCHATHTAVGDSLLQWYSAYETCMACHDGTLGTATYNVEGGKIGTTSAPTFGGMFGNGTEKSLSNHNVTGSMEIAAAPGGSTLGNEQVAGAHGAKNTRWLNEFGCESCHSPHGQGGNARILHPDANYAASWAAEKRATPNKYFLNTTNGTVYADPNFPNVPVYIIKGYPYSTAVIDGNTANSAYKIDNKAGYSKVVLVSDGTTAVTSGTVYVTGVASLQVKMNISGYLTAGETVQHVYGMNAYCGACHTDYNTAAFTTTGSAAKETGVYAQAHRHQMGMQWYSPTAGLKFEGNPKTMSCLTCHVAHGTSQDYWAATLGGTKGADGTLWAAAASDPSYAELAGSSALKRMPNMGTCEACHAKGEGSEGYNTNSGAGTPAGTLPTQPYDAAPGKTFNYATTVAQYTPANLGWVGSAKCLGCHEEYVDGWKQTGHALSGHDASGLDSGGCAQCHNPGGNYMWTGVFNPTTGSGVDDGITCESCHGTGKNHILAPSTKNIFNPGAQNIKRQVIECSRCHDMYKNDGPAAIDAPQFGSLAAKSGSAAAVVKGLSTEAMYAQAGWSVGFRVYDSDPAKFADASQKNTASTHFGGAWGYADSKHFLGSSTDASNPLGVVSCNTCHDMHSEKYAGGLKYEYQQICASCHDSSANLAQEIAMPNNGWARHQLEGNDYAHSFKFGPAAAIKSATLTSVNVENAGADGITVNVDSLADIGTGDKAVDLFQGAAPGGRGGAVGFKIRAYDGPNATGNQIFNNYAGTFELAAPAGVVEGVDYDLTKTGIVEFLNTAATYNTGKLAGTYTIKWTSAADSSITATDSFTITHRTLSFLPTAIFTGALSGNTSSSNDVPRGEVSVSGSTYLNFYHRNGVFNVAKGSANASTWTEVYPAATGITITGAPEALGDSVAAITVLKHTYLFIAALDGSNIYSFAAPSNAVGTFVYVANVLSYGGAGAWDEGKIDNPSIMTGDGGKTYRLYYQGYQTGGAAGRIYQIGSATSTSINGAFTRVAATPVLAPAASGWDSARLFQPYVVQSSSKVYYMFYAGNNSLTDAGPEGIGVAYSYDGVSFVRNGVSAIATGAPIGEPSVVMNGLNFQLWYLDGLGLSYKTGKLQ